MARKKTKSKNASGFETFNKSQQIYKLLEKGIIESEALSSSSSDRPEQEDHIAALLGSPEPKPQNPVISRLVSVKRRLIKPKKQKKANQKSSGKSKKPKRR